jgi:lipid II:glycine glycyltransferase (peptidoglycan interpeptide bridge formation enzyme)
MERNNASKKYFFPPSFISDHFKHSSSAILINCVYKDELISSSMFLLGRRIIHYHLSGNSQKYKGVYPSELTIWECIKWAKMHQYQLLQLGGGRGSNDLLYNFKKGFSQKSVPFFTGKLIFDKRKYEEFVKMNKFYSAKESYFPGYRQGFNEAII